MTNKPNKPRPSTADWYHVDQAGRFVGWAWPEDFKRDLDTIWGSRKGIAGFSEYTGTHRTTVEKYCNGSVPVPKPVALLVAALMNLLPSYREYHTTRRKMRDFPRLDAPWLPNQENNGKVVLARRPFG